MEMAMDKRAAMNSDSNGWRRWTETAIDGDENGKGTETTMTDGDKWRGRTIDEQTTGQW